MTQLPGEEERQLRAAAAEMLRRESPVAAFRALRDRQASPRYAPALWAQVAELGWTGMLVPEAYDGLAYGHQGAGLVVQELGRNLVASPFLSTCVLAPALLARAGEQQQAELLPAIAAGATTVALALDEGPRYDPAQTAARASRVGDGYRLEGCKRFVADGGFAEHLVVLARTGDGSDAGLSLFHVPAAALPASSRRPLALVDSRDYAEVDVTGVEVPATSLIGREGGAAELLADFEDAAAAHLAAELLGISDALFESTVAYLKVREQFGVPIGSFQALQHRAAVLFTELELLRSVVLDALAALDEDRADRTLAASHARAQAIDVSTHIATESIQLHGGMGVTDELDVGLYYKRTLTLRHLYGDAGYHRERYARAAGF